MAKLWPLALLFLSSFPSTILAQTAGASVSNTYDFIVVGSGPGGGPLAANLANAGATVLLLEAGDDQGDNLNEDVAGWFFLAFNDPIMRWDFFVKYHTDDAITKKFEHLTWKTTDGQFYVGTSPPPGATMLGVYYPRAGTLGGCSTHNALCAPLPSDSDWKYIADITGDKSWNPSNMRKYFIQLENDHSVPKGTPGHGFDGFLDITVNDDQLLKNQTGAQVVLKSIAKQTGQDPNKIFQYIQSDMNNARPDRDQQTGIFGFPAHRTPEGRRVSARNPVVAATSAKQSKLTLKLNSLVTKVIFDTTGLNKNRPDAVGVEYLYGKSMYAADPRYNASTQGTKMQAYARKEVILSGGAFNTPQILKLSGVGPKAELAKFKIPVLVDLPGVGANLQDNQEFGVIATSPQDFVNTGPACTYGAPGDPCLAAWYQGKGPYTTGPLDAIMLKTSAAKERDIFMWGTPGSYRGYWPAQTVNAVPQDPPSTYGFAIIKMNPQSHGGTVLLKSSNPRDVPDINFRFFEGTGAADLQAMSEAVDFGRRALKGVPAPVGPFSENFPCSASQSCDVKDSIKTQTWSHHATSSCAIGADNDPMAVLDSEFKVRGTSSLRVVDASAFPRTPGAFPVVPTFMISEKASEVILRECGY